MYKILLGKEDIPHGDNNVFYKGTKYSDKVYGKALDDMLKDKTR